MPSKVRQAPETAAAPYTLQTLTVWAIHALEDIQPRSSLNTQVIEEYATLSREAEGDDPLPHHHHSHGRAGGQQSSCWGEYAYVCRWHGGSRGSGFLRPAAMMSDFSVYTPGDWMFYTMLNDE